jgi:hypothetical protein
VKICQHSLNDKRGQLRVWKAAQAQKPNYIRVAKVGQQLTFPYKRLASFVIRNIEVDASDLCGYGTQH